MLGAADERLLVHAMANGSIGAVIGGALLIVEVLDSDAMMNHVEFL